VGIFKTAAANPFTVYRCAIQFRDKLMGGQPRDPKLIRNWIMIKTGITDEAVLARMVKEQLEAMGVNPLIATFDQVEEAP
jgi:hypothetical protein